jgi:hypothetical protein
VLCLSGGGGVGAVPGAGGGEDAEAGEGAAVDHGFFHVVVDLVAVGAGTIGGRYHGRVFLPDRHGDAVVAYRVGREDLIGEAAGLGGHPGVGCVYAAAEVDDAIDAEVGAGVEAGGGDDHEATAGVGGGEIEELGGVGAIEVVAGALVSGGLEEGVPGFGGFGEEGHGGLGVGEGGFGGGTIAVEADGAPDAVGEAIAVGAEFAGGADFPTEGSCGGGEGGEVLGGADGGEGDAMGSGKAGFGEHANP